MKALIYVQHLLGIGHLVRAKRIAEAMARHGIEPTIAQGGAPVDGLDWGEARLIQLDPVHVAPDAMSLLLATDGTPFDAERQSRRQAALCQIFNALQPDILLIEAFPFGRRQMRFELLPLLSLAKESGKTLIVSSIRDILQEQRKPERIAETVAILRQCFDRVLVHGDPAITPLAATFSAADVISDLVAYTGLVGPPPVTQPIREHELVVSVGGGAVGAGLLEAVIAALPQSSLRDATTLLLTGPNAPPQVLRRLQERAGPSISIARFVPDLAARLAGSRLAIAQAGYNTVADLLSTGCPAVLVPFAGEGETEQLLRAQSMASAGRAVLLHEIALSAATLAQAIDQAMILPRPPPFKGLDGAERTAKILLQGLSDKDRQRRASHRP